MAIGIDIMLALLTSLYLMKLLHEEFFRARASAVVQRRFGNDATWRPATRHNMVKRSLQHQRVVFP